MDPLLSTLILILLALVGARFSFSSEAVPAGPRLLFRTGTHFLFFGFLLGPGALGLVSADATAGLSPLLGLGLGWIGLHFGLQLDRETLKLFPKAFPTVALLQAAISFVLIGAVGWGAMLWLGLASPEVELIVWGAAAIGCISAPAGIAMVSANFSARGNIRQLLFFVASIDAVIGIVALQLIYGGFHASGLLSETPGFAAWWFWDLAAIALAVVCSVLFLWLTRLRPRGEELILYLLGISALSAGAALQLQLSPLFVGFLIGAIVSNASRYRDRIARAMRQWEQPIYMILLLLSGALLRFPSWWVIPLALGYSVIRVVAKVTANAATVSLVPLPFAAPRRFGLGLVPQGGISIAMALSFTLTLSAANPTVNGLPVVDLLFGMAVLGVVISDLAGPILTHAVLRRAGEITPEVEAALAAGRADKARAAALRTTPSGAESHDSSG